MFGLRQKLIIGFGGLLAILLVVSCTGLVVLQKHRAEMDRFLHENWRSVVYGQSMVDAVEQLNDIAKSISGEAGEPTAAQLKSAANAAGAETMAASGALSDFETNCVAENSNITLPGEAELADQVTALWKGRHANNAPVAATGYVGLFRQLLNPQLAGADRKTAYANLMNIAPRLKSAAQGILKINFDNLAPVQTRIKQAADRARRLMIGLSIIAILMAAALVALISRSILKPIGALTESAREIERGNLELVVQVRSHDELRQLAEAFNSMTMKLREYRRTNRAKLIRTQQTTQNAINSLPDAVAIVSPDGNIEMANTAAQRVFALRPDCHVSKLHADWLVDLHRKTSTDLKPIDPQGYESAIQVLDEGGGERFFLPHAVPILDQDQQLLGVTVVLADVTNLRRLDEMKNGMLSVVSHELKTPLTSIRMGVHLLLEERVGSLTAQQNEILAAVREDSDRLNRIVENLLDMSRIESGRALMELKPKPSEELIHEAVDALQSAYHDRGVKLTVDLPESLPPVMADPGRIGHVFSNLLTNALKYTPPGGDVTITAEARRDSVKFSVSDTGTGIPEPHQQKIFERFYRVPGQTTVRGAGLGLAIAKDIVHAHGGRITVESRPGHGSTFIFTLPCAPSATPAPVATTAPQHLTAVELSQ